MDTPSHWRFPRFYPCITPHHDRPPRLPSPALALSSSSSIPLLSSPSPSPHLFLSVSLSSPPLFLSSSSSIPLLFLSLSLSSPLLSSPLPLLFLSSSSPLPLLSSPLPLLSFASPHSFFFLLSPSRPDPDEHDIRHQENMLKESEMMVPETKKRLENAVGDLETVLAKVDVGKWAEGTNEQKIITEATEILQAAQAAM